METHVYGLIERYRNNATELDDALIKAINGDDDSDGALITNPFTNASGAASTGRDAKAVIVVERAGSSSSAPGINDSNKGMVYVEVLHDNKVVESVVITPYDNTGAPMREKTIAP
ncbi:hypothetical protein V6C27_07530 [Peptococcaceae bacterium 1198_IL3148]